MPIRPRDMENETEAEFTKRYADYKEELESDLHTRLAQGPQSKVYQELENQPEQLQIWANLMKPDTRFSAPYTKGYMLYLGEHTMLLQRQLEKYFEPAAMVHTPSEMSKKEAEIWDTLEEMILMMKALQIAVVG